MIRGQAAQKKHSSVASLTYVRVAVAYSSRSRQ